MKPVPLRCIQIAVGCLISLVSVAQVSIVQAEVKVSTERSELGAGFQFDAVPAPATNDAATSARWSLVEGERDANSGDLAILHDGTVPATEDQPAANFFFRSGTDGGRIQLDLGTVISIKQVGSYSWHSSTRAPQVYKLYAADGAADSFQLAPKRDTDPTACGWKSIAAVDTRTKDDQAGQHGVAIRDPSGSLGNYRYLLVDISQTEASDTFGNTFFSEFDVIDANGPESITISAPTTGSLVKSFTVDGGQFRFTIDTTTAPDLTAWTDQELKPVVSEWYLKIVTLLPSDGFQAPTKVVLRFRDDMGDVPAYALGATVSLNSQWFRRELQGEARGAVVHELVHVVQAYDRARRTNPNFVRTPGWIVEGIADYVRWFRYEPQSHGADITKRSLDRVNYDSSYRITGNFLNWVIQKYELSILSKLNAAAREGRYTEPLWKDWTGKTIQELGDDWKRSFE